MRTFNLYMAWVAVAAVSYVTALLLPAHYESGLDLGGQQYSGWDCLIAPFQHGAVVITMYPAWWANPLFGLALFGIARRWGDFAFACGVTAGLAAMRYALPSGGPFARHLYPAFWFWLAAMMAVSVAAMLLRRAEGRATSGA